jgi:hypothetical protein
MGATAGRSNEDQSGLREFLAGDLCRYLSNARLLAVASSVGVHHVGHPAPTASAYCVFDKPD